MTLFRHELKQNWKTMLIWALCIGLTCFGCLLLYKSLEGSLDDMTDMVANMGTMAQAIGLDKMSINTIEGYYATEIAIMFSLGGALYAAIIGTGMLSKEEEGHTAEFLHTCPINRAQIVGSKYAAMLVMVVLLNVICASLSLVGFAIMDCEIDKKAFFLFHGMQILMQLEIATLSFCVSSGTKKKLIGIGLGGAILFYAADIMCRIIPDLEGVKYITPFYYSNASDIFSSKTVEAGPLITGCVILVAAFFLSFAIYEKRDIT